MRTKILSIISILFLLGLLTQGNASLSKTQDEFCVYESSHYSSIGGCFMSCDEYVCEWGLHSHTTVICGGGRMYEFQDSRGCVDMQQRVRELVKKVER